jgi:hypothetical protein
MLARSIVIIIDKYVNEQLFVPIQLFDIIEVLSMIDDRYETQSNDMFVEYDRHTLSCLFYRRNSTVMK